MNTWSTFIVPSVALNVTLWLPTSAFSGVPLNIVPLNVNHVGLIWADNDILSASMSLVVGVYE